MTAISAKQNGRSVIYIDASGNRIQMTGNIPWRNNNPGDLKFTTDAAAKASGALGRDKDGFAIYPDYDTGRRAMEKIWGKAASDGKTIEEAIKKFTPPSENDTEKFINDFERETGLSRTKKVSDLTQEEKKKVYDAIQKLEGYDNGVRDGKTTDLPPTGVIPDTTIPSDILDPANPPIDKTKKDFGTATTTKSPVALDLDGDGVETIASGDGAYFDHDGNGFAEQTGWTSGDDGILVRDINGDGIINDGKELFGDQTILNNGTKASNGFQALSELDDNKDGKIDSNDAVDFPRILGHSVKLGYHRFQLK